MFNISDVESYSIVMLSFHIICSIHITLIYYNKHLQTYVQNDR